MNLENYHDIQPKSIVFDGAEYNPDELWKIICISSLQAESYRNLPFCYRITVPYHLKKDALTEEEIFQTLLLANYHPTPTVTPKLIEMVDEIVRRKTFNRYIYQYLPEEYWELTRVQKLTVDYLLEYIDMI